MERGDVLTHSNTRELSRAELSRARASFRYVSANKVWVYRFDLPSTLLSLSLFLSQIACTVTPVSFDSFSRRKRELVLFELLFRFCFSFNRELTLCTQTTLRYSRVTAREILRYIFLENEAKLFGSIVSDKLYEGNFIKQDFRIGIWFKIFKSTPLMEI